MNLPSQKQEFTPLLPPGRHIKCLKELQKICVADFSLSKTRTAIMQGFETVYNAFKDKNIQGEFWLDGSFLTAKIDPEDIDIIFRTSGVYLETCSPEQIDIIKWYNEGLKISHHCDNYLLVEWPKDHELYWTGESWYAYWMRQWGFSRNSTLKGIAVVVCP